MRGRLGVVLVTTAVVLGLTAGTALAVTHAEGGGAGAGETPGTAQQPGGTPGDPLTAITGNISTNNDVDMYRICVSAPATFSASTDGTFGLLADTQLFLFSSTGAGVYANDDVAVSNQRSTLPAAHASGPQAAGVYYLAISSFNADPRDATNNAIFTAGTTVIQTPVDGDPVHHWSNGGSNGTYTIALTGAEICAPTAVCATPPSPAAGDTVLTPNQQFTAPNNASRVIFGSTGNERIQAGDGRDIIFAGPGQDFVDGGDGADLICGQDGHDLLRGGGGADFIDGGPGNDRLEGGNGNDALFGGDGHDTLDGEGGAANGGNGGPGNDLCLNLAVFTGCP